MDKVKPLKILLVDDDELDRELILDAFAKGKLLNKVSVARDGEEALNYVYKKSPFGNASTPDIILLDINMPKINGLQVLKELKNHEVYKVIPVIMLTSSSQERDVMESYKYHANCYIEKPVDETKFIEAITKIEQFWLSVVHFPKK